jgi:hypothetical protein
VASALETIVTAGINLQQHALPRVVIWSPPVLGKAVAGVARQYGRLQQPVDADTREGIRSWAARISVRWRS